MSRRERRLDVAVAATSGLVGSALAARTGRVGRIEERVFRAANGVSDRVHLPVWFVMQAGSLAGVFVVSELMVRRRPGGGPAARITALTGTAVWGGVKALKPLVGRGRPEDHLVDVAVRGHAQSGLGYPSGHAAVSLAVALSATHRRPPIERAAALGVAAATGWARMYVGAHLPLDVVGGFAVGTLSGRVAERLMDATTPG